MWKEKHPFLTIVVSFFSPMVLNPNLNCYRWKGKGHTSHVCPSQVRDDELQGKGCIRGDYVTVRAIQ